MIANEGRCNGMFGKWYAERTLRRNSSFTCIMNVIETNQVFTLRSPIQRIKTQLGPIMKRGIRPVRYVVHQFAFARSQAPAWECRLGSSSFQSFITREAGASKTGFPIWRLGTSDHCLSNPPYGPL
jgi:hypothetical protein